MEGPHPVRAAWSMLQARRRRPPRPTGIGTIDHGALTPILDALAADGLAALTDRRAPLAAYLAGLTAVDPDRLSPEEAKAYWINLYNALALDVARRAAADGAGSVVDVGGAFDRPVVTVAGEILSLDDIEHGKVRRFSDPRVHAALVCGSLSCPTLHGEPYTGHRLDEQLDRQMSGFLAAGGAIADRTTGTLQLSRVFLWYGGDFARPHRMPTLMPARRRTVAAAVAAWLPAEEAAWVRTSSPRVTFLRYDWGLACSVERP